MNPEVNPFAPPPAYDATQIESLLRTQEDVVEKYKILRRLSKCLAISICINLMLVLLLGIIILDPLYNRSWIKRTPD